MKKIFSYVIAAAMLLFAVSCQTDDLRKDYESLENRVTVLEQLVPTLNSNLEALEKLYNATTVNKIEEKDGVYTLTMTDGSIITINQGKIGVGNTPKVAIKDGKWVVDYQDGRDFVPVVDEAGEPVPALGKDGITPKFGIDADNFWTISYDGGKTFEQVKDEAGNPVKALADGAATDSFFKDVTYVDGNFTIVMKNGEKLSLPVVSNFLCAIQAGEGVQQFKAGQSYDFGVITKGVATASVISCPTGWEADFKVVSDVAGILTVTAPAATKAVIADSRKDVSILAISDQGLACISKILVEIGEGGIVPPGPTPGPDPDPEPEPVKTDLYQAYLDGDVITVAGKEYSKAVNGEPVLLTAKTPDQDIFTALTKKTAVVFLENEGDNAFTVGSWVDVKGDLAIIGRHLDKPAVLNPHASFKLISGTLALKNITMDLGNLPLLNDKPQYFTCNSTEDNFDSFLIDGCTIHNLVSPLFSVATSTVDYYVKTFRFVNNTIEIAGNNAATIQNIMLINAYKTNVYDQFKEVICDNNIIYLKSGSGISNLQVLNFANRNDMPGSAWDIQISMCNNIIYDLPGRNVYVKTQNVGSVVVKGNVFYALPTNDQAPCIFCAYGAGQDASVINISDNIVYGSKAAWNICHAKSSVKLDPNVITKETEDPFEVANTSTGEFKLKAQYAAYGPQAK